MRTDAFRGSLCIMGATLFWSLSGVLAKHLFRSRMLMPIVLVQGRMMIAGLVLILALYALAPHRLRVSRRDIPYFLIHGSVGMAAVQVSYMTAVSEGSVSSAIFLQYTAPVLSAVYFALVARRLPEAYVLLSLVLATTGSALLLLGGGGIATTPRGVVAGLLSAVLMSFYTIYGARGVKTYSSWTTLAWGLFGGTLALGIVKPPWTTLVSGLGLPDLLLLGFMALFGTLLPFGLFLYGLGHVPPLQAILICMLEPVLATLFARLFLGESLVMLQALGGAAIIAAVAWVESRRSRESRRTEAGISAAST